jgi:hypothetical protein
MNGIIPALLLARAIALAQDREAAPQPRPPARKPVRKPPAKLAWGLGHLSFHAK